jgi:uroporphyrinogen decarboxylase
MNTLRDIVDRSPHRLVVPLMGFPGIYLTQSTIWQNEFNSELQYRTVKALVDRFMPDAVFSFMDLSVEAGAVGIPVIFPENGSPNIEQHPVKKVEDLARFKDLDVRYDARVNTYVDVIKRIKDNLDVLTGAYVIGPFTLSGLMMGATQIALATIDQPELVNEVLKFSTQTITRYGELLVEAGADMVCILEPTATFLSPEAFCSFSAPYIEQIVKTLDIPSILHICGNTKNLVRVMCETGVQGLSLDAPVDFVATIQQIPENIVLIGNVDPVSIMVNGTPDQVRLAVKSLLEKMEPYPNFILSTGCDLPPETMLKNIQAFMEAGRAT